ncbi:MAG: hypothetical protein ACYDDC_00015 [Thermoplasmataceae archaeon]
MTRVVKSRDYKDVIGYIPDEFDVSVTGTEERTRLVYTETYQQSEAFFLGLSKRTSEKMNSLGWAIETNYNSGKGKIIGQYEGNRRECIGKLFLEIAFQAKCFHDHEDLLNAFNNVEVKETWREDEL